MTKTKTYLNLPSRKFLADVECVICRLDEKGESVAEAIEAVTGHGKGEYFHRIKRYLHGDKTNV